MTHIKELFVNNFRGLQNVKLEKLTDICIITGDNSAGKTAILESIYFSLASAVQLPEMPLVFRSNPKTQDSAWDNYWLWLFSEKVTPGKFNIRLMVNDHLLEVEAANGADLIDISYSADQVRMGSFKIQRGGSGGSISGNFFPKVTFFSPRLATPENDAEKFSALSSIKDGEDQIINLVRILDSRIQKIRYLKLPKNKSPLVYLDIGLNNFIPASQMGQGFCTLFSLCLELLTSNTNILLVDEIENGLHRDALADIWNGLAKTISFRNIQLFATTHSKECINAAYSAATANENVQFSHHSLKFQGSSVFCKSEDGAL